MLRRLLAYSILPVAALALGCSSSAPAGPTGGPVADAADQHCLVNGVVAPQKVGMCVMGGVDAGATDAAAADDGAAPGGTDYGETLYNSSGYDDDCKFHMSFTSTPIRRNTDVTFTLTVEGLDPAGPALKADPYAEVYLTESQPAPNSNTMTVEKGGGVYEIGPVVFDHPGLWTVRFHVYETCSDAPADSPHGHAAFYVDVP
jgi:hypothetical protein